MTWPKYKHCSDLLMIMPVDHVLQCRSFSEHVHFLLVKINKLDNLGIPVKALTRVLSMLLHPRRLPGTLLSAMLRGQLYPLYW